jgi:hypothetical protein
METAYGTRNVGGQGMLCWRLKDERTRFLDALIPIVSYDSRAVDGGLHLFSFFRTFDEHSSRFLFLVIIVSEGVYFSLYFLARVLNNPSYSRVAPYNCFMHWVL